jgi:hypothetical protein
MAKSSNMFTRRIIAAAGMEEKDTLVEFALESRIFRCQSASPIRMKQEQTRIAARITNVAICLISRLTLEKRRFSQMISVGSGALWMFSALLLNTRGPERKHRE